MATTRRSRGRVIALGCVIASAAGAFAKPPAPRWLKVEMSQVTVVTTLDPAAAAARAREFAQYLAALRAYTGEANEPPPLTMVVFARAADFRPYRPLRPDGEPQPVMGFFERRESWAVIGATAALSGATRHVLFHEGVHWYLHRATRRLPPWLDEGMAEVFSTFELGDNEVRWGRELPGQVQLLHDHGTLSLRQLLFTTRAELNDDPKFDTSLFYTQAWLFVHYLMFGDHRIPRDAAQRYVALLATCSNPDEAFRTAFGSSMHDIDMRLNEYLTKQGRYRLAHRPLVALPAVRVDPASAQEVDQALGRLALVGRRFALAKAHGEAMRIRALADPRGHLLLAEVAREEHRDADAALEFSLAARFGSADFEPYFETANALHRTARAGETALAALAARSAVDFYEQAIARQPTYEPAYDNLSRALALLDPLEERDRAVLRSGSERFPDNVSLRLALAVDARRRGETAAARAALAVVLARTPPGAASATYARQLEASWDLEDRFNTVKALSRAGRYDEAMTQVRQLAAQVDDAATSAQIGALCSEVETESLTAQVNEALAACRWAASRALIARLLASDASGAAKQAARRLLHDLDERSLTTDPVNGDARAAH